MILLIVDDQDSVLNSLREGIDWKLLGIDQVYTAQNAMEARLAFRDHTPDIMLCDIEMPVESGVDLCRWIRTQKYETQIVFLTCHSEFSYAQEAITLGAADYILQPVSIERVQSVVQRQIEIVKQRSQQRIVLKTAENYSSKKKLILSSVWKTWLNGTNSEKVLGSIEGMPTEDQWGYLVMVQQVRWESASEVWNERVSLNILSNTMEDLFAPYHMNILCVWMGDRTSSVLLLPQNKNVLEDNLDQQLKYLCALYDMYMPCQIACAGSGFVPILKMPKVWKELVELRDKNVSHRGGLLKQTQGMTEFTHIPQIAVWRELLLSGCAQQMAEEARIWIKGLEKEGNLDADGLLHIYQEFIKMLYATDQNISTILFASQEAMDRFRNGMKTVNDLISLIDYVVQNRTEISAEEIAGGITERIKNYIDRHLEQNIRKEDLVELVHMDADYITRCFKRDMGMPVKTYIITRKMEMARELLLTTNLPVTHIAMRLGYVSLSHFSTTYRKQFGVSPQEERENRK